MPLCRAKVDCRLSLDGVTAISLSKGEEKELPEKALISFGQYIEEVKAKPVAKKKTTPVKKKQVKTEKE